MWKYHRISRFHVGLCLYKTFCLEMYDVRLLEILWDLFRKMIFLSTSKKNKQNPKMITSFPREMLQIILRNLSNKDHGNFHKTCKKFSIIKGTEAEEFVRRCLHGSQEIITREVLHDCCRNRHIHCVKHLIKSGLTIEDVRARDNEALRWSAENGHLEVVKFLMSLEWLLRTWGSKIISSSI